MRKKSLKENNIGKEYNGVVKQSSIESHNVHEGSLFQSLESAAQSADLQTAPDIQGAAPALADPMVYNTIVEAFGTGAEVSTAAALAGVQPATVREWIRKGENNTNKLYAQFVIDAHRAAAQFEQHHTQNISKHSQHDWKASAWLLERRFPHRWSSKQELNVNHNDGASEQDKDQIAQAARDPQAREHLRQAIQQVYHARQSDDGSYEVEDG